MLNFAEQTGSGAVMLVWSFPSGAIESNIINSQDVLNLVQTSDDASFVCILFAFHFLWYFSKRFEPPFSTWLLLKRKNRLTMNKRKQCSD